MPMNRVQFQPGLSMVKFMDLYGTKDKCEAALVPGPVLQRQRVEDRLQAG
jgi:hypothetical protein